MILAIMTPDLEHQIRRALDEHRARGIYPVPEQDLRAHIAGRGALPRGFATHFRAALRAVAYRERPRRQAPWAVVARADAEELFGIAEDEIVRAVEQLRAAAIYPAPLARVAAALELTPKGKAALSARLARGQVPASLALVSAGARREQKLVRRGEEHFARALGRAEVLRLRLLVADLEAQPRASASDFGAALEQAYDELARALRTPFVPLPRLRAQLARFTRAEFERGVVALCQQDRYQLAEHEQPASLAANERTEGLVFGPRATLYHFIAKV